jgi:hypothetical protein
MPIMSKRRISRTTMIPAIRTNGASGRLPPAHQVRRPIQRESAHGNADLHWIENIITAYRKHKFRRDGRERRQQEAGDTGQIIRRRERQDQRQDERRNVDRLCVGRHTQQRRKQAVGDPANSQNHDRRKGQRGRIIGNEADKAESEGHEQQARDIMEGQPVHRDAVKRRRR